jgi:hypothetical protein
MIVAVADNSSELEANCDVETVILPTISFRLLTIFAMDVCTMPISSELLFGIEYARLPLETSSATFMSWLRGREMDL